MKQTITLKQLNELSEKGHRRLKEWIEKVGYYMVWDTDVGKYGFMYGTDPLLSIGQMIEFLGENLGKIEIKNHPLYRVLGGYSTKDEKGEPIVKLFEVEKKELVDALWQPVKEKLEK